MFVACVICSIYGVSSLDDMYIGNWPISEKLMNICGNISRKSWSYDGGDDFPHCDHGVIIYYVFTSLPALWVDDCRLLFWYQLQLFGGLLRTQLIRLSCRCVIVVKILLRRAAKLPV